MPTWLEGTWKESVFAARRLVRAPAFTITAVITLALGTVGVDGTTSYIVSQRTSEIGVRLALGANPGNVARMIVWQATTVAMTGLSLVSSVLALRTCFQCGLATATSLAAIRRSSSNASGLSARRAQTGRLRHHGPPTSGIERPVRRTSRAWSRFWAHSG